MNQKYTEAFGPEYFEKRTGNDPKRQKSFLSEKKFINKYICSGKLLDVGCSTGEFIDVLEWSGEIYGMEISEYAQSIAEKKGIKFDKNLLNSKNFFDIIIFRGTIQHIDTPFLYLKKAFESLKPGGFVVFLMTPNTNSIYFKLWNTLPFLAPELNFYVPSDLDLKNAMQNFGFIFKGIRYPYFDSVYASPIRDHLRFIKKMFTGRGKFPFWRNSMDVIFQKPTGIV
jgi:SAM-dependent methyltransferase